MSKDPQTIHIDIHYGKASYISIFNHGFSSHPHKGSTINLHQLSSLYDTFHTFAIEREKNLIRWLVDDVVYKTIAMADIGETHWIFNERFYFLFNLAIGGSGPGYPDLSTSFPQSMEIDYIRVYDKSLPSLQGIHHISPYSKRVKFEIINPFPNCKYVWKVPKSASIVSGQNSNKIEVDFGFHTGIVECATSLCSCSDNERIFILHVDRKWSTVLFAFTLSTLIIVIAVYVWRRRRNSPEVSKQIDNDDEGLMLIDRSDGPVSKSTNF